MVVDPVALERVVPGTLANDEITEPPLFNTIGQHSTAGAAARGVPNGQECGKRGMAAVDLLHLPAEWPKGNFSVKGPPVIPSSTSCPACISATEPSVVYTVRSFPIERCPGCGHGRTIVPPGFRSEDIYQESYFDGGVADGYSDYLGAAGVLKVEFSQAVRALRASGCFQGRLLEIGSAYGFFLSAAQPYFDVRGIEIVPEAVEYSSQQGLSVACGAVSADLLARHSPLDAVVMLDVIEHLEDPIEALRAIGSNLGPGGHLMITTGDWDSVLSRLMGKRWRLMTPPQHLHFFTKRSLLSSLEQNGFEIVSFRRPTKRVSLNLILFQWNRMLGRTPRRGRRFQNVGIPVNLFDAMRVIAKKRE